MPYLHVLHCLTLTPHSEALGIPYRLCGTSEINKNFRDIVERNYCSEHMWGDMKDQVGGEPCLKHQGCGSCKMTTAHDLDLWVMGTPCPPFSEQNSKRHQVGAVESHPLYPVTFNHALDAIKAGHRAYILEQVPGFGKPYHPNDAETPLQRFFGRHQYFVNCSPRSSMKQFWVHGCTDDFT